MYWYIVHYCNIKDTSDTGVFATIANGKPEALDNLFMSLGYSDGLFIADISPVSKEDLAGLKSVKGFHTDVLNYTSFMKNEYFAPKELCL